MPCLKNLKFLHPRLTSAHLRLAAPATRMDEQYALLTQAMAQAPMPSAPIDVSVSRQYGDNTVTLRTQIGTSAIPAVMPTMMPTAPMSVPLSAAPSLAAHSLAAHPGPGIARQQTRNSFYDDDDKEKMELLQEIDRLKRKGLSMGITLTSSQEVSPRPRWEDQFMLSWESAASVPSAPPRPCRC